MFNCAFVCVVVLFTSVQSGTLYRETVTELKNGDFMEEINQEPISIQVMLDDKVQALKSVGAVEIQEPVAIITEEIIAIKPDGEIKKILVEEAIITETKVVEPVKSLITEPENIESVAVIVPEKIEEPVAEVIAVKSVGEAVRQANASSTEQNPGFVGNIINSLSQTPLGNFINLQGSQNNAPATSPSTQAPLADEPVENPTIVQQFQQGIQSIVSSITGGPSPSAASSPDDSPPASTNNTASTNNLFQSTLANVQNVFNNIRPSAQPDSAPVTTSPPTPSTNPLAAIVTQVQNFINPPQTAATEPEKQAGTGVNDKIDTPVEKSAVVVSQVETEPVKKPESEIIPEVSYKKTSEEVKIDN